MADRRNRANVSADATMPPPVAITIPRRSASTCVQHVPFQPPVVVFSVEREQLAEAEIGRLLNASIELEERQPQPSRKPPADCRLSSPSQSQERNHLRSRRVGVGEQRRSRRAQRACEIGEPLHRDVPAARIRAARESGATIPSAPPARARSSRGQAAALVPALRALEGKDRS